MNKDTTLTINVETVGAEKAEEEIHSLASSIQMLPPQVTVQDCHNCEINIHPSQNIWQDTRDEEVEDDEADRV
jgi:hypothetical protein